MWVCLWPKTNWFNSSKTVTATRSVIHHGWHTFIKKDSQTKWIKNINVMREKKNKIENLKFIQKTWNIYNNRRNHNWNWSRMDTTKYRKKNDCKQLTANATWLWRATPEFLIFSKKNCACWKKVKSNDTPIGQHTCAFGLMAHFTGCTQVAILFLYISVGCTQVGSSLFFLIWSFSLFFGADPMYRNAENANKMLSSLNVFSVFILSDNDGHKSNILQKEWKIHAMRVSKSQKRACTLHSAHIDEGKNGTPAHRFAQQVRAARNFVYTRSTL